MTSGAQSRTRCQLLAILNRQGLRLSCLLRVHQRGSARNHAYLMYEVNMSCTAGQSEVLRLAIEIALPAVMRLPFVIAMLQVQARFSAQVQLGGFDDILVLKLGIWQ